MKTTASLLFVGMTLYAAMGAAAIMLLVGFAYNEFAILAPIGYSQSFALWVLIQATTLLTGGVKMAVQK